MQAPISQGVTTDPSTAQVLEQWSSGYQAPLTLVPTVHRIEHVNANPYIPRSYERPSVGTIGLPTVHRLIYPAHAKRLSMCRGAMQSIFVSWVVLPPSANWRTKTPQPRVFL